MLNNNNPQFLYALLAGLGVFMIGTILGNYVCYPKSED